jgi:tryptophan-rich sensory protein
MLVGGGAALAAALLTRLAAGSPAATVHQLEAFLPLPPLWLMGLLWLSAFALAGAAAGEMLTVPCPSPRVEALAWRGATALILAVVFSLVWYTLLFGKFLLLASWLCLPLSAAAAAWCALSWGQVNRRAACILWGFALWEAFLFFLQLAVLFHA